MAAKLYSSLPTGYILRSTISVFLGASASFFAVEYAREGNEEFQRRWLMPFIHCLFAPEAAHRLGVLAVKLRLPLAGSESRRDYPELHCKLFGRELSNPIGLAAGFDKDGKAIKGLRRHCGFGFIEVGSVTPVEQPGNPKPRVFRLAEDQAVINSYGFNSRGLYLLTEQLKRAFQKKPTVPIGVNLGKNKAAALEAFDDYVVGAMLAGPFCDYLVVNISSPNTPGLRTLQTGEELKKLLARLGQVEYEDKDLKKPKLFLKISPDLSRDELKQIAQLCLDPKLAHVDGLIVGNTTTSRPEGMNCLKEAEKLPGGLSGAPLRELSTKCVREMYSLSGGRLTIIGCGGISTGQDAYEKIRAGASAVQLYTALVYGGFPVVGRVKRELAELLRRDGFKNVAEAVGADHREGEKKH